MTATPLELAGLPPRLGRYELMSVLGRGGMGRVVRGHDPVLRRDVAIKLVEPVAVDAADLPELRYMFHREARAVAALRHPGVIEVYDYSGAEAELLYLACELVEGPTLRVVLDQRGRLPEPLVAALGHELALALGHAHSRGIVHRDVKPDNVFWTAGGRIVVADFGIAKAFSGGLRLGGTVQYGATNLYGSPSYMAPEQLSGEGVGPPVDAFALGALLFEAQVGAAAFGGADVQAIFEAVLEDRRRPLPADVQPSARMASLIDRLLAPKPTARPSLDAAAEALRAILDEHGVGDPRRALTAHGSALDDAARARGGEATLVVARTASSPRQVAAAPADTPGPPPATAVSSPPHTRRRFWLAAGLALAAVAGGVALLVANRATRTTAAHAIPVTLRPAASGELWVDGESTGSHDGPVTVRLIPGRHRVELRRGAQVWSRDILLLDGTAPTFDVGSR